jgi:glycosyltransferase involved in cell wall biosynthesis
MKQDSNQTADIRLVLWGTPDLGKPRTRILINGLRSKGVIACECVFNIWGGVEDKSQVRGALAWMSIVLRYCMAYPALIFRYLRSPRHDVVLVAYMGHLDVLILWPFAKLRRAKIVWDAFLSLYGTIVEDRKMISARHPLAWTIHSIEQLACKAADVVVLDTHAHADYFCSRYGLSKEKFITVWVGAETDIFHRGAATPANANNGEFNVLFYGQFIPLHGIEFIIDAARRTCDPSIKWTIVGRGQERAKIDELVKRLGLPSLRLIDWVDYCELPKLIAQSDLCLGVFGVSDKAARVIPNKVFQILAVGRPLATADTPAIREIVTEQTHGVWLVEPGSGVALAGAVAAAKRWKDKNGNSVLYPEIEQKISPQAITQSLIKQLERTF